MAAAAREIFARFLTALAVGSVAPFIVSVALAQESSGPTADQVTKLDEWATFEKTQAPHGPAEAEGAVIWLHDWCPGTEDCSLVPTPSHITHLASGGWDIFRVNVPPSHQNRDAAGWRNRAQYIAELTVPRVRELRDEGYRRVVLTGYSGGAIAVLFIGTQFVGADAIIAMAPCCGVSGRPYIFPSQFLAMLRRFEAPRVMIFFFEGEPHAPPGLAAEAAAILESKGVIARIYDRPLPFLLGDHDAAMTSDFTERFGSRILDFAKGIDGPAAPDTSAYDARLSEEGIEYAKQLQTELKEMAYYTDAIDGDFGPKSRSALTRCVHDEQCKMPSDEEQGQQTPITPN
jgi:hypothetical protein